MKSLKKRQRIQVIALLSVTLAVAAILIGYGFREGINLFRSPTQVLAEKPEPDEIFRIGGLVAAGSWEMGATELTFVVTDVTNQIPLICAQECISAGIPDLLKEETMVIATGTYAKGAFLATRLLAKHDEKYSPKEVCDALRGTDAHKDKCPQ